MTVATKPKPTEVNSRMAGIQPARDGCQPVKSLKGFRRSLPVFATEEVASLRAAIDEDRAIRRSIADASD